MGRRYLLILVIVFLTKSSLQDVDNNEVGNHNDIDDQHHQTNYKHPKGPRPVGDMLMGGSAGDNAAQIVQGLSSMMGGKGVDPSMISAVMDMVSKKDGHSGGEEGGDFGSLFSMLGSMFSEPDKGSQGIMDFIPMLIQTYNSFVGPDADERERSHQNHAWLLPPIVEKVHVMIDHFMNSDMGRNLIANMGAEKFIKIFHDEQGRFSYPKFVEMLENHSFRKHWISMVTSKIANIIAYVADPEVQKKYLTTAQYFINSVLRTNGYPKSTFFDPNKPTETLTAMVNLFVEKTFNIQISAKQYVKPLVDYVQDLLKLAQKKGILGADSRQLSDKLSDTINLDIIEPIARVNRAYRFATKVKECDRYVMCLVNQEIDNEPSTLGGVKPLLSKSTSLVLSWFLSSHTGTSFWSLYHYITEDHHCEALYHQSCDAFHIEEVKVKSEYVHNEL